MNLHQQIVHVACGGYENHIAYKGCPTIKYTLAKHTRISCYHDADWANF